MWALSPHQATLLSTLNSIVMLQHSQQLKQCRYIQNVGAWAQTLKDKRKERQYETCEVKKGGGKGRPETGKWKWRLGNNRINKLERCVKENVITASDSSNQVSLQANPYNCERVNRESLRSVTSVYWHTKFSENVVLCFPPNWIMGILLVYKVLSIFRDIFEGKGSSRYIRENMNTVLHMVFCST
jgi:hypothetical protein